MRHRYSPDQFTSEQLAEMRDWCLDCAVNDDDLEEIESASVNEIVRYVDRCYCGGIPQFLADSIPV